MIKFFDTLPPYAVASWDSDGRSIRDPEGRPRWSGKAPPPSLGEEVHIHANGAGPAIVTGYSAEGDDQNGWWLNARCKMLNPPESFLRRHGENVDVHVPGVDLSPITNEIRARRYKVEFVREERDCPSNRDARASGGRIYYDYAILINGERRGTFAVRSYQRGYFFEDLDDFGIGFTAASARGGGEIIRTKGEFESAVRRALELGVIPTVEAIEAKRKAQADAEAALALEQEQEATRMRQWRAIFDIEPANVETRAPDLVYRLAVQLETLLGHAQDLRDGRTHPLLGGALAASKEAIEDFKRAFPRYGSAPNNPLHAETCAVRQGGACDCDVEDPLYATGA